MKSKAKLVDDMKKLQGFPPHNNWSNLCYGDGYFKKALERDIRSTHKYTWDEIYEEAKKGC